MLPQLSVRGKSKPSQQLNRWLTVFIMSIFTTEAFSRPVFWRAEQGEVGPCHPTQDQGLSQGPQPQQAQSQRGLRDHGEDFNAEETPKRWGSFWVNRKIICSYLNLLACSSHAYDRSRMCLTWFSFVSVCLYNGKTYSHGDMWHPVLGKVLECIVCTCINGLQDCKRLTCPSQYTCQHPVKLVGKCCKSCPGKGMWLIDMIGWLQMIWLKHLIPFISCSVFFPPFSLQRAKPKWTRPSATWLIKITFWCIK